jgi:hypothetical protein
MFLSLRRMGMNMQQEMQRQQTDQLYIFVCEDENAPLSSHPHQRVLAIASQDAPQQVCGFAFRVGWIRYSDQQPIYRLRVSMQPAHSKKVTLPDFFVLEHGVFVAYQPTEASAPSHTL